MEDYQEMEELRLTMLKMRAEQAKRECEEADEQTEFLDASEFMDGLIQGK